MSDHKSLLQNIQYEKVIRTNTIIVLLINHPEFELQKKTTVSSKYNSKRKRYFELYKYKVLQITKHNLKAPVEKRCTVSSERKYTGN